VRDTESSTEPSWWNFIGLRRRYVSDRTWFKAALIVAALGSLAALPGWWKVADLIVVVVGIGLVQSGIRRALRRRASS
jgi:hypothetical protein